MRYQRNSTFVTTSCLLIIILVGFLSSCNVNSPIDLQPAGSARVISMKKWDTNVEDLSIGETPIVKDGILHFRNSKSFFATIEKLGNMDDKERISFTNSMPFKSLLSIFAEFEENVRVSVSEKNKDNFDNIVRKYSPFVKVDSDGTFTYVDSDLVRASILSPEKLVYIGKMLYYFGEEEQKIVFDGDKNKLNERSSETVVSFKSKSLGYIKGGRVSSSCPTGFAKEAFITTDNSIRNRMIVTVTKYINYWLDDRYDVVGTIKCLGKTEIKTLWYWTRVPSGWYVMESKWTFSAYPPVPRAFDQKVENNFLSNFAPTNGASYERQGESVQIFNLTMQDADNTLVQVTFPSINYGYWQTDYSGPYPMTCP